MSTTDLTKTTAPTTLAADARAGQASDRAVTLRGVRKTFGANTVIEDLDLDIAPGQFVALLGASGCGKSTLLRIVAGLDQDVDGEILVARRRAVAFQAPRLLPWKKVWRNVTLGVPGASKQTALEALKEVRLGHRAEAWPLTLSGGEAQRASLARALVRNPDLLLLDEPFGALDALTRIKAQQLVADLWERHAPAVLLVTHDVDEAIRLADRILVMADGRIQHDVTVDLPRRRSIEQPGYVELSQSLLAELGVHA